ncbi:hypothetical protein ACFRQM_11510 [Streptomyces sp. NPDC056831]|uniref:hypothetical protein n=1 Tax=Streptomyces sp. NPDC056831 TaxID=3345954 RepID=UPI0036BF2D6C
MSAVTAPARPLAPTADSGPHGAVSGARGAVPAPRGLVRADAAPHRVRIESPVPVEVLHPDVLHPGGSLTHHPSGSSPVAPSTTAPSAIAPQKG